jgi:ubiquinol-cytochrome c reductase cytochrome c subunit
VLRRILTSRYLLPAAVLVAVGLGGVAVLAPGASAQPAGTGAATTAGTGATTGTTGTPAPTTSTPAAPSAESTTATSTSTALATPTQYTVAEGDTLWSIAQRFYGEGSAWTAIAQANLGHTMAGGATFADASLILPGWVLTLPAPASAPTASGGATANLTAAVKKVVLTARTGTVVSVHGTTRHSALTAACVRDLSKVSYPGPANSGSPNASTYVTCVNGRITSYGSSAITYNAPPRSYIAAGEALFDQNCSSCHQADAQGGPAAPSLIGVGPATVDFWVTTGRMPAATPLSTQAQTKPPRLTDHQAEEVAAFITSLSPAAPFIPTVHLQHANLATGATLFALNCAACHTITGMGDELAYGTNAPTLHDATATQVAEAIRTGPGNMPRFTGNLTDSQVRDVVAYVTEKIQHPENPGGFGLGGIGPVAEGFVALLFGVGGLMLVCFWIGDRS